MYVIERWDGSPGCDQTAPPQTTSWSVSAAPRSATLCVGQDVTIEVDIVFSGLVQIGNFIVQADAPVNAAIIVPGSVQLSTIAGTATWSSDDCSISNGQGYSYFTCQQGGLVQGGDIFKIRYQVRTLNQRVGVFRSEITTFPPVHVSDQAVELDMTCGSALPSTTPVPSTTSPPVFDWTATLAGPARVCANGGATCIVVIAHDLMI